MKRLLSAATAALALFAAGSAQAGSISDTGAGMYYGADGHGYGDVIGNSVYDVSGATITRVGTILTVTINTNYAGHAGSDGWAYTQGGVQKGTGYGDVFLGDTWNPVGNSTDHYTNDNSSNGTIWDYGFNLLDRWNNAGGAFTLYKLKGATNAANIQNSNDFINCTNGCTYRNGQEVAVKTTNNSANVQAVGSGTWTVLANQSLQFTVNVAGTDLATFQSIAMHWGETCQNDVIEGIVRLTPTPGSLPLLALGLGALAWMRRRA